MAVLVQVGGDFLTARGDRVQLHEVRGGDRPGLMLRVKDGCGEGEPFELMLELEAARSLKLRVDGGIHRLVNRGRATDPPVEPEPGRGE
jgi:hypothetical protein